MVGKPENRTGLLVKVQIISMIQFHFPQIDNLFFSLIINMSSDTF